MKMEKLFKIAFVVIPVLWIATFFLPGFFAWCLPSSGQFGDGFGVVNSLFAGMGFLGLLYTLQLQMKANKEQKDKEMFTFLYSLVTEVKDDYDKLEYGKMRGMQAVHHLHDDVNKNRLHVPKYNSQIAHLDLCNHLFINSIDYIRRYKESLSGDEFNIIVVRLHIISEKYIDIFVNDTEDYFQNDYNELIKNSKIAVNLLNSDSMNFVR